jgi:hypothetical protein
VTLQVFILTDLSEEQLDGIRRRVRASIESIDEGRSVEYVGREGLQTLADRVKAEGAQARCPKSFRQVMRYRVSEDAEPDLYEMYIGQIV